MVILSLINPKFNYPISVEYSTFMYDKPVSLTIDDPHFLADLGLLVRREEIGHLAGIQEVADVFQKAFLLDLRVHKEENRVQVTRGALPQDVLQILVPFIHAI